MKQNKDQNEALAADQAFDRKLRSVMNSAPVPEDLQGRLRARIRAEVAGTIIANSELDESPDRVTFSPDQAGQNAHPPVGVEQAQDVLVSGGSKWASQHWRGALALTACLAFLLLSISWLGDPPNQQQLAAHCVSELDSLNAKNSWQPGVSIPDVLQGFIQRSLRLSPRTIMVGESEAQAGEFGEHCRVWKLSDRLGDIYIIAFEESATVRDVASQLRMIQDSGRWSLAASRSGQQLIVVAAPGDVRRFFNPYFA